MFSPIAIVGHACLLPGADSPERLWAVLRERRTTISPVPEGRWRADRQRMLSSGLCVSDAGGFVGRVEPEPGLEDFDVLVHWLVRVGRQALEDAGMERRQRKERAGAIVGNLAYPTESLIDLAQSVYLPETRSRSPHPLNRFSSGLPIDLLCRELGLAAGGYALDAACASSLYAIRIASDWLHRRRADVMLAGGINRVDPLLIHSGFTALRALSPTGRSRPFHRDADGLVPAEGAALLVLKRLADAEASGDRILAVIRGIGLSNDGRGSGLLTPSLEGQVRAMKAAYSQSGIAPGDVSLIECHATGTAVGDSIEIQSMSEVFAGRVIPIGSLKSNLGHLITASGAAGIVKVIQALRHGVRPATLHGAPSTAALEGTPFRLLDNEEPWLRNGAVPRLAALNSFGFGGNNAHLLLQEYVQGMACPDPSAEARKAIAVVGLAARAGSGESTQDFVSDFLTARSRINGLPDGSLGAPAHRIQLPAKGLIFPPRDLDRTLAQQNLLLEVALESLAAVKILPVERTAVLIGMQCDVESTRTVLRLALPDILPPSTEPAELRRTEDAMDAPIDAARVVGCMPNMPANRLNRQFGLGSGSFTVAAEELSGVRALDIAIDWLTQGEIDAAVVGASDLCVEPVHRSAMNTLGGEKQIPGDGATVLVLKRLQDAVRDNDTIRAVLEASTGADLVEADREIERRTRNCFGHVHAASGLLQVTAAVAWLDRGALQERVCIETSGFGGQSFCVVVAERDPFIVPDRVFNPVVEVPGIYTYDAEDICKLSGLESASAYRLAIVATTQELQQRLSSALEYVKGNRPALPEGAFFRRERMDGDVAFVFTGAAAAYPGMGRDLLLALPQLLSGVKARCEDIDRYAGWVYSSSRDSRPEELSDFQRLCGSSFLSQVHFEFTRSILRIAPHAAIGLSSGETNSLYAFDAWQEMHSLLRDLEDCGLYTTVLGGRAEAVQQAWAEQGIVGTRWTSYWVSAPRAEVEAAIAQQDSAVRITIINSENDVVIGGEAEACRGVVSRIGVHRAVPMGTDLAVHCPEVRHAAALWRSLHHRPTMAPSGIRFYSNALGHAYPLTADAVADALTGQALDPIDFPRTIRRAYEDGVHVFIEHGPRAQCTQAIRAILGDLPHVAVAMDGASRSPVRQALFAAAELWTAGVEMDLENLRKQLGLDRQVPAERPASLVFPAHPPLPVPPSVDEVFVLPAAPKLAPLLDRAPALPTRKLPAVAAVHARISEVHREHLSQLALLDQEFQALQTRLLQSLDMPAPPENVPQQRSFTRKDLEVHASGMISSIFGAFFAGQDGYTRQVRMPEPPLLLADRVTSLHGEPGSMGRGSITTETDVIEGAWYLHHGRMPAGITIESGQADLMLISWLGVDALNKGERAYRLLGCELSFSGSLPRIGETLRYDIEVDGHASHGDVRMFFFHYDCTVGGNLRLRVRNGQAGFFTDAELAGSEGVLWSADAAQPTPRDRARLQPPHQLTTIRSFDEAQTRHFAEGRPADCFGTGFERAFTHTRSPRTQSGRMQLLHRVPLFEPAGGPWQRGYLRAEWTVRPDDWFFQGHFKADPCMPGTLMFEACLQAMAFYMGALGMTLGCDGWRFEPVPDELYTLRCRGQVLPSSKRITYEVFVDEIIAGPVPAVFADVLCTVDGLKAFHCARLGLRLVPDWPLEEVRSVRSKNVPFDQSSLMSCALGRPSNAFGENFMRFDGPIKVPRLPGPPYHFMSRVVRADRIASAVGAVAEVEYDVPADGWYFAENGHPVMPVSVLTEVLLQPCGWLASYAGTWLEVTHDIFFRNLDGAGVVHSEIWPDSGVVRTRATLTSCSRVGAMTITAFEIVCHVGDRLVFEGTAVFGHFPAEALANQAGLAAPDDERRWLVEASPATIDLESFQVPPLLAGEKLRMIDRISGYWPDAGPAGLGRVRAEKDIDPRQWFFKAHFFTDPVQPGSLGLEAVIQTLQAYMLARRCDAGFHQPRFEPIANAARVSWTYRGQVLAHNKKVTILLEVAELGRDATGAFAKATASLWVDGMKIYALPEVGMRMVEGAGDEVDVEILDPQRDTWLRDHCPTYTIPVLPMMSAVDRLASAAQRKAPHRKVLELRNVQLNGWIAFPSGPRRLKTSASEKGHDELKVSLSVWRDAPHAAMSRYDVLAHAEVLLGDAYPPAPSLMPPLRDAVLVHDPPARSVYEEGELFHGPGFRFLTRLWRSNVGASFQLDSRRGGVPPGFLNQAILDGIAHGIPNEHLRLWSDRVAADQVGYPSRVTRLALFAEPPADGLSDCEVRFAGFHQDEDRFPQFAVQLVRDGMVWAEVDLVYALFSKGPIGLASGVKRRRFLEQKIYVPGLALGSQDADATHVRAADIAESDWLPGTVDAAFGLTLSDRVTELAIEQHVARSVDAHPASVHVAEDFQSAVCSRHPLTRFLLKTDRSGETTNVRFDTPPRIDCGVVRRFWEKYSGLSEWPIADLYVGAAQRFVRRVELTDPAGFESLRGKAAMFLANHQVGIESILFYVIGSALSQVPIKVLAKVEHRNSPVGQLIEIARRYPGVIQPEPILYFDRSNPASMLGLFDQFRRAQSESPASLMVHVEGTRATSCRTPVAKVSSVLLDLALQLQLPIVPVRFAGGLPVEPVTEHLDFPFRLGRQDIRFGSPLSPDTLRALPLAERSRTVLQAINALAPEDEQPLPAEPMASRNVLVECLRLVGDRSSETERLLAVVDGKRKADGTWEADLAAWLTGMGKY